MGHARAMFLAAMLLASAAGAAGAGEPPLRFEDTAAAAGLAGPLRGMMAHAAACGDADGDGRLDLYVGAFCDRPPDRYKGADGPVPNVLLVNEGGRFRPAEAPALRVRARTSGAVFVDLDNDGDLDLYVSNNSKAKGLRVANRLFENVGGGRFRDVSEGNAACPVLGGRSVGVLDFDGDGLLDLLVTVDGWTGGGTRLYRNAGGLAFEDVTERAGLPADLAALGVVTPDLTGDGRPDIFVTQSNRLFLSQADGTYREGGSEALQYEPVNREAAPAGVACGDVDGDGRLDLVIVDHAQPARTHLFLNEGLADGVPRFRDVRKEAGIAYDFPEWTPERLHLKHAHVQVADVDLDGRPDIVVAATWDAGGAPQPFVLRNLGGSPPRFHVPPLDRATAYFACGPVADVDRDGRLDVCLASWFPEIPTRLLMNRGPMRRWLRVRVRGRTVNRMGVGSKVRVYRPGHLGEAAALLGYQEIGISEGFCTGGEAVAHFGLGDADRVDVEVVLPHGKGVVRKRDVAADRTLLVTEP
ncbi:MAG: CRTAC1 family protein [Phycisphaerae bacterium]